jgi:hypothetical protein
MTQVSALLSLGPRHGKSTESATMKLALAGLVILLIGDSHIASKYFFNNALHDALMGQGAIVDSYGVCGSGPRDWVWLSMLPCGRGERHQEGPAQIDRNDWVRAWSIKALIGRHHPNMLIVEFGDNMAGYGVTADLPRTLIRAQVSDLTRLISASKIFCIWIGPPWGAEGGKWKKTFSRVEELSDYLSHIVAPCHYVNSLALSKPGEWPTLDGVHLTPAGYQLWAKQLVKSITQLAPAVPAH